MSRLTRLILVAAICLAVLALAGASAVAFTARSSFCVSCHEMQGYYDSWQQSTHAEVGCVDCHVPHGPLDYLKTKVFAFREVYVHFTGEDVTPLSVTRNIPQANCLHCHDDLPDVETADGEAAFDHSSHDRPCLDCHVRVVHRDVAPPAYTDPATMDACFACHDGVEADDTCSYCHEPTHPRMGACDECHGSEAWTPADFEHPVELADSHAQAECTDCHAEIASLDGSTTLGPAPNDCASCHEAPHVGMGACDECHTTQDWSPSKFQHPYPLAGRHAQADCQQCHAKAAGADGSPILGEAPTSCSACHTPPHAGMGSCDTCHTTNDWSPSKFRHPLALTGRHARATCAQCHKTTTGADGTRRLAAAPTSCASCHRSPHGSTSDCSRCHSVAGWTPVRFSHRRVGEHIPNGDHPLSCSKCHPSGYGSSSCSPCHSNNRGGGGGDDDDDD